MGSDCCADNVLVQSKTSKIMRRVIMFHPEGAADRKGLPKGKKMAGLPNIAKYTRDGSSHRWTEVCGFEPFRRSPFQYGAGNRLISVPIERTECRELIRSRCTAESPVAPVVLW